MTERNENAGRAPGTLLALLILIGLLVGAGWTVYHAPFTTLAYVRTLVWPVVTVLLVLIFRSPLRRIFQDVVLRRFEGFGAKAEFEPRPPDQHVQATDLATLREALAPDEPTEADPTLFDADPCQEVRDALDNQTQLTQQLLVLLAIFDTQLDFLSYLQAAPNGLEPGAVDSWLARAKQERPGAGELTSEGLLSYLTNQSLVEVSEAGNYVITAAGRLLLEVNANVWHAPKVM